MQLTLKQGHRGENKQKMDTDPLAKPTETHRAVLALYHMKSAAPSQKGASFVTGILVWGTQADRSTRAGERLNHTVL